MHLFTFFKHRDSCFLGRRLRFTVSTFKQSVVSCIAFLIRIKLISTTGEKQSSIVNVVFPNQDLSGLTFTTIYQFPLGCRQNLMHTTTEHYQCQSLKNLVHTCSFFIVQNIWGYWQKAFQISQHSFIPFSLLINGKRLTQQYLLASSLIIKGLILYKLPLIS